ncbi:hypothetical protein ACIRP3_42305 [Streptomyces sp. NPDC101209]|uniref:hypothetical protein n=1 Tax=Streptomyces sp. NPDC101209 TaxID=3366129 RepID=UPI0038154C4C
MITPAAGGSVLAQFDDIPAAAAPELAGHEAVVHRPPGVAPDAPAYGTKLR